MPTFSGEQVPSPVPWGGGGRTSVAYSHNFIDQGNRPIKNKSIAPCPATALTSSKCHTRVCVCGGGGGGGGGWARGGSGEGGEVLYLCQK